MSLETFDYGDDDDSLTPEVKSFNELDDLFGTSGAEQQRSTKHNSLLTELNIRVMLQLVVAVLLLAVAGVLLVRDVWARQARDTAFHQMVDATGRGEYLRVIEGAEKFLTRSPLNGSNDAREANVVSLYSEALMHWVAQQPGKLDTAALAYVRRYQQLVKSGDK
jgi:hypothetical protein